MTFDTQSQNCSKTDNPWNYITEVNILNPTLSQHRYYGNNTDNICHIHAKTYFNMKKILHSLNPFVAKSHGRN